MTLKGFDSDSKHQNMYDRSLLLLPREFWQAITILLNDISLLVKYSRAYLFRPTLKSKQRILNFIFSYFRGHHRVQRPQITHKQH